MKKVFISCMTHLLVAICAGECFSSNANSDPGVGHLSNENEEQSGTVMMTVQNTGDELGAGETATGVGEITTGAGETATGARETATGARETATGAGETATGARETATGAGETATGARETATGARETATGVGEITTGGPALDETVRAVLHTTPIRELYYGPAPKDRQGVLYSKSLPCPVKRRGSKEQMMEMDNEKRARVESVAGSDSDAENHPSKRRYNTRASMRKSSSDVPTPVSRQLPKIDGADIVAGFKHHEAFLSNFAILYNTYWLHLANFVRDPYKVECKNFKNQAEKEQYKQERIVAIFQYLEGSLQICQNILGMPKKDILGLLEFTRFLKYLCYAFIENGSADKLDLSNAACESLCMILDSIVDKTGCMLQVMQMADATRGTLNLEVPKGPNLAYFLPKDEDENQGNVVDNKKFKAGATLIDPRSSRMLEPEEIMDLFIESAQCAHKIRDAIIAKNAHQSGGPEPIRWVGPGFGLSKEDKLKGEIKWIDLDSGVEIIPASRRSFEGKDTLLIA